MPEAGEGSLYLGLPNTLGRNKSAVLGYLKDRMMKRINSWNSKILSRAGKEVLIKTVIQSLPTFAMGVFLLPKGLCDDMERGMARFWWKSTTTGKGIHWQSWKKMTCHKNEGGMGFRSLQEFNLAMLGKQGWRLVTRPESLVARIFKARYYHDKDFLSAEIGSNPSYIWRSVRATQSLLLDGLRCRVGTGAQICIMRDAWLQFEDHPRILHATVDLEGHKVCSLFQENARAWDVDVVRDIFNEEEANIILGIPLSVDATEDSWYWGKDPSGDYTVKTAYRACREMIAADRGSNNSGLWRKLWQLKVPPKVKDMVWRAVSNILPTRVNLRAKYVEVPLRCVFCDVFQETIFHCILACEFARNCWRETGIMMDLTDLISIRGCFERLILSTSLRELGQIAVVCWAIWGARNELVWHNRRRSAPEVVAFADNSLSQWMEAQGSEGFPSLQALLVGDGLERWVAPDTNVIKVNVDVAIFPDESKFGVGFVARDSQGKLLAALARCWLGVGRPEVVESIGVKEALSWVKTQPRSLVILESDCLLVVRALRSKAKLLSGFGLVIEECKVLLASLSNVWLHFVKRSANRAVHCLARHARVYADRMYKEGFVPPELSAVLAHDLI